MFTAACTGAQQLKQYNMLTAKSEADTQHQSFDGVPFCHMQEAFLHKLG